MAIDVRPAVEADLPTLTSILLEAEAAHPIVALPWADRAAASEFFLQSFTSSLFHPLKHVLVATITGGDTAGYAIWQEAKDPAKSNPVFPEGTNTKVLQTWLSAQSAKAPYELPGSASVFNFCIFRRSRFVSSWLVSATSGSLTRFLDLTALAVLPRYQGQGVGLALVKSCTEQLDIKHLSCVVSSSVPGKRVYEKSGFNVLQELTTDYSKFEGGQHVTYIMRREAKKAAE